MANIALDRPTNASSMAEGHQSKLASDGDNATYWAADASASGPQWWECNLEGIYDVSSLSVRFAGAGSYAYEIQATPDDRVTWKTVVKGTVVAAGAPVTIALPAGTRTSGLRIVLDSVPARAIPGLAEVAVRGARAR